jgi:hypothetical protein
VTSDSIAGLSFLSSLDADRSATILRPLFFYLIQFGGEQLLAAPRNLV